MYVMSSRPLREGFRGVGRHWSTSLSSALAVTLTLIIIGIFMVLSFNVQAFTDKIEGSMQIAAIIDESAENDTTEKLIQKKIEAIPGVKTVTYSSKEEEFQYYLDSLQDEKTREAFEPFKDDNPMHDAFYVETETGSQIADVTTAIEKIDGISQVSNGGQSTLQLVSFLDRGRQIGSILVIALSLLAIFQISNTIKLTIYSRMDEITIERNVGATNHFIRAPFVVEGMITGAMGSLIPIALLIWGYQRFYESTGGVLVSSMFSLVQPFPFVYYLSAGLLIVGVFVGLIGSFVSVTRYLRWKR